MFQSTFLVLMASGLTMVAAQVPGFGSCPGYVPMTDFEVDKFLGKWYEAERMFQLLESAGKCVSVNYNRGVDGVVRVTNKLTGRITGIQRILEGEVKQMAKKGEGKMIINYALPVSVDTEYSILDTDYTSYAVLWHCSNYVPFFNTQNAWIMTRSKLAHGRSLKKAYSVLEKYNIPRSSFSAVQQENCDRPPAAAPEHSVEVQPALSTPEKAPGAIEVDNKSQVPTSV